MKKRSTWEFILERIKVGFYLLQSLFATLFIALGCSRAERPATRIPNDYLDSGRLLSWETRDSCLILRYAKMSGRIAFVNGGTVWITAENSAAVSERYSYAVVSRKIDAGADVTEDDVSLTFRLSDAAWVRVSKDNFRTEIFEAGQPACTMTAALFTNTNKTAMILQYRGERFFGLGEKTGAFELTGRSFVMYNSDTYKYGETTDPIYSDIPFYLAVAPNVSYGVFADNPARSYFELKSERYVYAVDDTREELYFFPCGEGAGEFDRIVEAYTALTGKPYLPPLYGFGFHQSRYSYTNQAQVLWVANQFRANDLPLDVLYLDIGFMSNKMAFTYDHQAFPDPSAMNAKLAKMGVRTVAIVDPGIKADTNYSVCREGVERDVFVRYRDKYFKGAVWPGMCYFPDFTKDSTQAWWQNQYKALLSLGIEGYWNDMNEPSVFNAPGVTMRSNAVQDNHGNPVEHAKVHNVYGLSMIRATHTGLSNLVPDRRVFLLTRSAYAGAQRYAFIWTGDNSSMWKHLRMNLSMAMNLGLSGMPYCGADIGGYTGAPTPELFVRWIQMGTFIPFMRDHTEAGTAFQEPYVFTEQTDILRRYLKLRYRLLPYLYTQVYRAYATGLPIVKPLFLDFGRETLDVDTEFLFGDSMLVAPVLDKGVTNLTVVLPGTMWYGYFDGTPREAGSYDVPVTLSDIPVYVKSGTVLPTWEFAMRSTQDAKPGSEVTWVVYPDALGKASGTLYEDDGISMNFARGEYSLTAVDYAQDGDKASITFRRTDGQMNARGKFTFVVPASVRSLTVNGRPVSILNGKASVSR